MLPIRSFSSIRQYPDAAVEGKENKGQAHRRSLSLNDQNGILSAFPLHQLENLIPLANRKFEWRELGIARNYNAPVPSREGIHLFAYISVPDATTLLLKIRKEHSEEASDYTEKCFDYTVSPIPPLENRDNYNITFVSMIGKSFLTNAQFPSSFSLNLAGVVYTVRQQENVL